VDIAPYIYRFRAAIIAAAAAHNNPPAPASHPPPPFDASPPPSFGVLSFAGLPVTDTLIDAPS
jgi:hypothetical protein